MVRKADLRVVEMFGERLLKGLKSFKIILFGSRAGGSPSADSDFDLIIVSKDFEDRDVIKRCVLMYEYWDYNFAVDFVCYTPKEFNERKKRVGMVSEALRNGVVIK